MAETLNVQVRDNHGKRHSQRLRKSGVVPAVLYGHGEKSVSLAIPATEVSAAVRHGSRLVELKGAISEKAFIRDLQWDTYGLEVVHLDLTRISEHERVKVQVAVDLRGEAAGIKQGGIVEQMLHEVQIECPVSSIPDKLHVNVSNLNVGDALTVGELPLPEGVKMLSHAEVVVVHCVMPTEEEELALPTEGAEPEVIGRKAESEEEG
jgi:large subunit ribosomal protein L25